MFTMAKLCFEQSEEIAKKGYFSNPKSGVSAISPLAQPRKQGAQHIRIFLICASGHSGKIGSEVICVRHEIALQPGLAIFEEYPDPKDGKVKLDGDNIIEFQKLPEFPKVTLKVLRWADGTRLIIKEAQMVD